MRRIAPLALALLLGACSSTPTAATVRRVSCAVGCRACDAIDAVCGCDAPTAGGEADSD